MADSFEVAVVGGGTASVTVVLRARDLGANVAIFERGNPGGTGTHDGCVLIRVFAHAARLARDARRLRSGSGSGCEVKEGPYDRQA